MGRMSLNGVAKIILEFIFMYMITNYVLLMWEADSLLVIFLMLKFEITIMKEYSFCYMDLSKQL